MSRDRSQLLLFITVPDSKTVKNRMHLDLRPADRTRDEETDGDVAPDRGPVHHEVVGGRGEALGRAQALPPAALASG